jgi:uncharacterized protein
MNHSDETDVRQIRKRFSSISIKKGALVTLFFLLPAVLILFILDINEALSPLRMEILAGFVLYSIPLLLIFYAFKKAGLPLSPILEDTGRNLSDMLLVIPLLLFSVSVIWITILALNIFDASLASTYLDYLNRVDFLVTTPETPVVDYFFIFVAVALLAPLLEEIVFRGAMIERFGRKYSYKAAVLVSSVIFAILHIDIAGAFVFGVVTSLIYLKTRSLYIPVMIHLINNGMIVIFMYFNDRFFQFSSWDHTEPYLSYGWLGILLFSVSSFWLIIYIKQHWNLVHTRQPFSPANYPPDSGETPSGEPE